MVRVSKSIKTNGIQEEYPSSPTRYVAFQATAIKGDQIDVPIRADNILLSTKAILYIRSKLTLCPMEIFVNKIAIMWCPLVEPGSSLSISISIRYNMTDNPATEDDDDKIVLLAGKMSEHMHITIYPTRPLIYTSPSNIRLPWTCSIDVGGNIESRGDNVLGILKVWCPIQMKKFNSSSKLPNCLYHVPKIEWSNMHYPYYLPYYVVKDARGYSPLEWKNTKQYRNFKQDILLHVGPDSAPSNEHLPLMQTITLADVVSIMEMTRACLLNKGGSNCSCKDEPSKYISMCRSNRKICYSDHQTVFDNLESSLLSGRATTIKYLIPPKF